MVPPNNSAAVYKRRITIAVLPIPGYEARSHASFSVKIDDVAIEKEKTELEFKTKEGDLVILAGHYEVPLKSPKVKVEINTSELLQKNNFLIP